MHACTRAGRMLPAACGAPAAQQQPLRVICTCMWLQEWGSKGGEAKLVRSKWTRADAGC